MGEAPRLVSGFEGAPWRRWSCGGCCLYGATSCLLIPGPWNCDSGEQRGPRTRTRTDLKAPPLVGGVTVTRTDLKAPPLVGGVTVAQPAGLRPGHVSPSFPSHGARGLHPRAKARTSTHILGEQRSARWSLGGGSPSSGTSRASVLLCGPRYHGLEPRVALAPSHPPPRTVLPGEQSSWRHRAWAGSLCESRRSVSTTLWVAADTMGRNRTSRASWGRGWQPCRPAQTLRGHHSGYPRGQPGPRSAAEPSLPGSPSSLWGRSPRRLCGEGT